MKKSTLELYKELFTVANDHNDMLYAKHAREFHAKYPDCPTPKMVKCLEIEVDHETAKTWADEDGEADMFRIELDEKMAEQVIDRKVLEYIKENVTEPELLANLSSCISPLRSVQSVAFHTEDYFWHCIVRIDEIDTSVECTSTGFWYYEWDEEPDGPTLYFAWSKVIDCTYRDSDLGIDYVEHNVVMMKWNPAVSNYSMVDFKADLERFRKGDKIVFSWDVWDYDKVQIGDRVFAFCVGDEPTGIVATGTIIGNPYVAEDRSEEGRIVHNVDFQVEMMFNPYGYIHKLYNIDPQILEISQNEGHSGIVIENNALKDSITSAYDSFYNDMYLHRPEQFRDRP